ncbi:MAG TPA: presqualene diphosphate synthase HpnD [Blastocatellia bacterium]|nr:presqualene diphosphate synthase HpnD [Blastocatellia bacterium]
MVTRESTAIRDAQPQPRTAAGSSSSFYYSFLLLPRAKRKAIKDVYEFCRVMDEIVDQHHAGRNPRAELDHWRIEIEASFQGRPSTSLGERLSDAISEFDLPKQPFIDIIDGMQMDLEWKSYQSFADLREYCYRAASAVGLICIEIFGYESPRTREYAVNLGLALQLTNILRDLKEDIERDRIYVPLDELERFGYSEDDLRASRYNAPFQNLMQHQYTRAKSYFDRAAELLPEKDRSSMFAAEIMGTIYRELLEAMDSVRFDVYRNRVSVPKSRRLKIALNIWLRSKFER